MMNQKVLLILVDGMRPDSLAVAAHPFIEKMKANAYWTLGARTVMPSVTLPCHMSLFHSVDPERHGILSNTYVPQVRPVRGLFETVYSAKKKTAIFYNWEQLRDLSRPDYLSAAYFAAGHTFGYARANQMVTEAAIDHIKTYDLDCSFLYLGFVDEAGHAHGWMGEEYIAAVRQSWDCIERVVSILGEDYTVIVTADHGGHNRAHGSDMPEDMTIPLFIYNKTFTGAELENASILDIAPTITGILGVEPDGEWEGKNLLA